MQGSSPAVKEQRHGSNKLGFKMLCTMLVACAVLFAWAAVALRSVCAEESVINCYAHQGACSQAVGDFTVILEISPRPVKAMQDLTFYVTIAGWKPLQAPYLDLGMPGMQMGPNRVLLTQSADGRYEGKGVIVRCPSGRRTWFANATIPGLGEVKFIFNVIY